MHIRWEDYKRKRQQPPEEYTGQHRKPQDTGEGASTGDTPLEPPEASQSHTELLCASREPYESTGEDIEPRSTNWFPGDDAA